MKRTPWLAALALGAGLCLASAARGAELRWAEALTSGSPARLAPFYEKTLGLTSERAAGAPNDAVVLLRGGRPVAGIVHRAAERRGPTRSRWVGFFAARDLPAAEAKVLASGGRLLETAHEGAGAAGRRVLLADPEGAVFGLLPGEDAVAGPMRGLWPVLLARRPDEAAGFYLGLLGGEREGDARTPLFKGDFLLRDGGRSWAGVQPCGSFGQAGWMILFAVADIETATKTARSEGGRVLREPVVDLIGGRVAVISDPAGGVFGLYEALPLKSEGRGAKGKAGAAAAAAEYEVEALP